MFLIKTKKTIIRIFVFICFLFLVNFTQAQIPTETGCGKDLVAGYFGCRIENGSSLEIEAKDQNNNPCSPSCQKITNNSGSSLYIPLKVCDEWTSFLLSGVTSSMTLEECLTGITGSGTARYIPIWTDILSLANSIIYQTTENNIGISTITPAEKLHITGRLRLGQDPADSMDIATKSYADSKIQIPTISGNGTANYMPFWSNSTSLANSIIYQSSSNIGIGIVPAEKLHITGRLRLGQDPIHSMDIATKGYADSSF